MSEIYIKWNKAKSCADSFSSYSSKLSSYGAQVSNISNDLKMSSSAGTAIKNRLNKQSESIIDLAGKMECMAQTLEEIAQLYESTENSL